MAKKKQERRGRPWLIFWLAVLFIFMMPVLLILLISAGKLGKLPDTDSLENPHTPLATEVISADGELLGKYFNENRSPVDYEDLSPQLVNALLATEDARFYDHSGVDFRGLVRVFFKTVLMGQRNSGGGSTISQQLAKNLFPRGQRMNKIQLVIRKLQEWVIATRLERLYTKEEILAMYLNTVDFGSNAVGIKSAAGTFFNKAPSELNAAEAAVLVGLLKAPTSYSPVLNPKNSEARRNTVLSQMNKYEYLTDAQYDSIRKQPIVLHYQVESHNEGTGTYFREYVRQWLREWADAHGYDMYADGLRVYTSLDSRLQHYAEEATYDHMKEMQSQFYKQYRTKTPWAEVPQIIDLTVKRSERFRALKANGLDEAAIMKSFNKPRKMNVFSYRGGVDTTMTPLDSIKYYKYFLQPGFMAMEPNTGQVKVWVGGVDMRYFKYDHVDPKAKRQVGSTFKPFVYATAIMNGYSPCMKVPNVPVVFEDYENWTPKNSDNKYGGEMTLRKGLATSTNCITAWVMKEVGVKPVVALAQKMGIKSHLEPVPSLCLGTADISVYEMVAAFNTFNNNGQYIEPVLVTRIEDKNGNVIQDFVPKTVEVLDDKKSYIMMDMLKGVTNCSLYGTACRLRYRYGLQNPMGGKTGTTQNNSDGWFMGLIPQLTGGIWIGAEDRAVHFDDMKYGQGAAMALPIWGTFLQKVYADKSLGIEQDRDWPVPAGDLGVEMDCGQYEQKNNNNNIQKDIFSSF